MRTPSSTIAMQLERPLWDSHSELSRGGSDAMPSSSSCLTRLADMGWFRRAKRNTAGRAEVSSRSTRSRICHLSKRPAPKGEFIERSSGLRADHCPRETSEADRPVAGPTPTLCRSRPKRLAAAREGRGDIGPETALVPLPEGTPLIPPQSRLQRRLKSWPAPNEPQREAGCHRPKQRVLSIISSILTWDRRPFNARITKKSTTRD